LHIADLESALGKS